MSKETNPMTFQITEPGFYRQRNGGKAEVFAEREGVWFGRNSYSDAWSWTDCGTSMAGSGTINDIVGPWHEPPEPIDPGEGWRLLKSAEPPIKGDECQLREGGHGWFASGNWIDSSPQADSCVYRRHIPIPNPEPIDPGEGWRLLEDGETIIDDDEFIGRPGIWCRATTTWGMTVRHARQQFAEPEMIAYRRRIPKPFSISEHGPGIYETRGKRNFPVVGKDPNPDRTRCWHNKPDAGGRCCWDDTGSYHGDASMPSSYDLVRYIGPLPPEQPWVPTTELRWTRLATGWGNGISNNYNTLEQKWTRGTESEWRAVKVTP